MRELAIKSLENKSDIIQDILVHCKDLKLNFLVKEILQQKEKKSKAEIQAELLAYQGKIFKAVQTLIDNKQIDKAVQIFVTLGEYEKAIQILKNPSHQQHLNKSQFNLKQIVSLQAEDAQQNGQTQLAIELYTRIKSYDKVADVLIKNQKSQDLINLVRNLGLDNKSQVIIYRILKYFLENKNLIYAKECYIKLDDKENLIKMYINNEQFEEALKLFNQISSQQFNKEILFIPYAEFLMGKNKFQESLDQYKKIGKINLCVDIIELMILINKKLLNYRTVANLTYEYNQMKNQSFDNTGKFYLFLGQIKNLQKFIQLDLEDKEIISVFVRQLLCLCLSLLPQSYEKQTQDYLATLLQECIQVCIQQKQIDYGQYFLQKLIQFDQSNVNINRYKFSLDILQKNNKNQIFVQCLQCDNRGFQCSKMQCTECKLQLFFCSFSGKQLPIIELQIDKDENIKNISTSEILRNNKFEAGSQNWDNSDDNKQFVEFFQKTYQLQDQKQYLTLNQEYDLQHLNLDQFLDFKAQRYFYKYDYNSGICICQNCESMYDMQNFEDYDIEQQCLLCGSKEFFSFI